MDGVLLIDKPAGLTSHDVVALLRRSSGERRIGHTGTLDPLATGLLPLVLGQATRLSAYLTRGDKTYEATIRLGFSTETDDALGKPVGAVSATLPGAAEVDLALARFRGTFEQMPPQHSAKMVAGRRAYELARRDQPVALKPVVVTVRALTTLGRDGDLLQLEVTATAGFYVRGLARDLGAALGCGAHLRALRRTRSGAFHIADALAFEEAERLGPAVAAHVVPPARALPHLPAVTLNAAGLARAVHGNPLGPGHLEGRPDVMPATGSGVVEPLAQVVRLLALDGRLVALAEPKAGALHPVVVLG